LLKQQLLDESNRILLHEKEQRLDAELQQKKLEFERDQLQKRYAEVQAQLASMDNFKERYALKMEESIAQSEMFYAGAKSN
jgi:ABC-type phosphate transport system auxiliary subunit